MGRGRLNRGYLLGVVLIVLGIGFVASRAIAVVVFGGSAVAFLWGLVIGLSFAVGGTTVLCVTDRATDRLPPGITPQTESRQTTVAALAAALTIGLIAAAVL